MILFEIDLFVPWENISPAIIMPRNGECFPLYQVSLKEHVCDEDIYLYVKVSLELIVRVFLLYKVIKKSRLPQYFPNHSS